MKKVDLLEQSERQRRRRAGRLVGRNDAARLRWLIGFAEGADALATRAQGELDIVGAMIRAFAERAGSVAEHVGEPLTRATVIDLAQVTRDNLRAYAKGATPTFPPLDFQFLEFALVPGEKRGPWMGPWRSLFLIALADVVRSEHDRLRACSLPECGRLFFRRKRGLYCSRRCSKEQRMRRFRRDPVRYSEKRHQYYVQRLARLKGVNLKTMDKMVKRRQSEARPSEPTRR
jgi:hypothetical protein